jgi:hypothetical protein
MGMVFFGGRGQERASNMLPARWGGKGSTYTDSEVNKKWPSRRDETRQTRMKKKSALEVLLTGLDFFSDQSRRLAFGEDVGGRAVGLGVSDGSGHFVRDVCFLRGGKKEVVVMVILLGLFEETMNDGLLVWGYMNVGMLRGT